MLAAASRDAARLPCAGDWVLVRTWPDDRVTIEAVLPRRTAIVRRTADKDSSGQVLAANLDTAAVVEPLDPSPDVGRIERLLALAWDSGARPLVVLTKCDAVPDPAAVADDLARSAPGVEVLTVSAKLGTGLDLVRPLVAPGRTLGLLGPSGAGKSTLVNALAGAAVMGTRAVRESDGKGRHMTTVPRADPDPRWRRGAGHPRHAPGRAAGGRRGSRPGVRRRRRARRPPAGSPTAPTRPSPAARSAPRWSPATSARAAGRAGSGCSREVAYETRRREARQAAVERARLKQHRVRDTTRHH